MTKATKKKYQQSPKGKAVHAAAQKKYRQTKKGKAVIRKADVKYHQTEKGKLKYRQAAKRLAIKYPEKVRARNAVKIAVRSGRKFPAKRYTCLICAKKPATQWHHFLGYAPEHHLDVIPVCTKCHRKISN